VLVYVAEKFILRLTAGQILRKGVSRKMRRLTRMLLDCHILVEVLQDVLEDFADYTSM
jgi:pentose-5-phosphate-3-epimerase